MTGSHIGIVRSIFDGDDVYVDFFDVEVNGEIIPVTDSEICLIGDWLSAESKYFWTIHRQLHNDVLDILYHKRANAVNALAELLKLDPKFTDALLLRMKDKGLVETNDGVWDVSAIVRRRREEEAERFKRILTEITKENK
jgi:DNA-binding MarR family transcriptional regulator